MLCKESKQQITVQSLLFHFARVDMCVACWKHRLVADVDDCWQGLNRLSVVAASAAQNAASVVQSSTKDLTAKVCNPSVFCWVSVVMKFKGFQEGRTHSVNDICLFGGMVNSLFILHFA